MPAHSGLTALAAMLFILIVADLLRVVNRKVLRESDESGRTEADEIVIAARGTVQDDAGNPSPVTMTSQDGGLIRKWIITHTDFDGLTSGALLFRLLGKEAGVMFSSPASLLKVLKNTSTSLISGDSIHIADLALQPHLEHDYSAILNNLRNRGIEVTWIDHHEWPAGLVDRMNSLCTELLVDPTEKTAAVLIRRKLEKNDDHADRLIRFVQNRSSESDADWDRLWRLALTETCHRRDPEISETLIRSWAENELDSIQLRYLARQGEKRERATAEIASHSHRREKTTHNRTMLVIDARSRRLEQDEKGRSLFVLHGTQPSIMVGSQACRLQHADFCIIVWDDFRYSVYRGLDSDLEFGALFGQHERNRAIYRVGGHQYAISVRVVPTLWAQIKTFFRFRLGPETEVFIELLRERY